MRHLGLLRALVLRALACTLAFGCGPDGAPESQRALLHEQIPHLKELIQQDRQKHREGIVLAARLLAPGFLVEDPTSRERQMRAALRRIQEPAPRGTVPHFLVSPMSFLAAVGADGIVIARDSDDDHMKGEDFGARYPAVHEALETGATTYQLAEFPSLEEGGESSWAMIFVAASRRDGEIVGAVVAGIPLWREAERLSRQLRVDHAPEIEQGLTLWVYMYKGDRVFYGPEAPPELNDAIPDAATRAAGLARSPGGFTGQFQAFRRWYGFALVPTPGIAEDVGILALRAEKPE